MVKSLKVSRVLLVVLAAMLSMAFASTYRASAATDAALRESITLSPASKEYNLKAGDTTSGELTVVNDGQTDYDFIVYSRPYSVNNSNYDPNFETTTAMSDVYKWVSFPKERWSIQAGKTIKIPYTLTVPQGAAPGGHYGVLFAETQPAAPDEGSVARKKRVGSILYATVDGQYRTSGEVVSSTIPGYISSAPLTAKLAIKNTGNTHFKTTTSLKVKDVFGGLKYKNEKDYFVLPDTTRDIKMSWEKAPWFGLYRVELTTRFLNKETAKDGFVLIMPIWFIVLLAALAAGGIAWAFKRR